MEAKTGMRKTEGTSTNYLLPPGGATVSTVPRHASPAAHSTAAVSSRRPSRSTTAGSLDPVISAFGPGLGPILQVLGFFYHSFQSHYVYP